MAPRGKPPAFLPTLPSLSAARLPQEFRRAVAIEWERGTAFLFAPVLMAAGALTYFAVDREPYVATVVALVTAVAILAFLARSRLVLHLALAALLCFTLGMLFAKFETVRAETKVLGGEISTRLTGRVAVIEHQATGRIRMTIDVLDTERPKLKYMPQRVRVSARAIPDGLKAGDVIAGVARLGPPSGPTRPDGYDFSFNSYFDGIGANGFFLKGPELAAGTSPTPADAHFFAVVENLRTDLANHIRGEVGGEAEGEIAAALVAGVRAGIPDDVNEALRRTGLAHILSISGLHMALVAATIMTVLRLGFACFPDFASRRPVKKYAASAALVALAALPLHLGRRGRRRAQLHHDRRHADRHAVRPRGAHHAQPRHLGDRHHHGFAARSGGAELPDVVRRNRRVDRRLCRVVRTPAPSGPRPSAMTKAACDAWRARSASMP